MWKGKRKEILKLRDDGEKEVGKGRKQAGDEMLLPK